MAASRAPDSCALLVQLARGDDVAGPPAATCHTLRHSFAPHLLERGQDIRAVQERHVTAAEGYVELGLYLDANAELEEVKPERRHMPEVLAVRVQIYRGLQRWELMQTVASRLAAHEPDNPEWAVLLAYAARRAQSVEAAPCQQRSSSLPSISGRAAVGITRRLGCAARRLGTLPAEGTEEATTTGTTSGRDSAAEEEGMHEPDDSNKIEYAVNRLERLRMNGIGFPH